MKFNCLVCNKEFNRPPAHLKRVKKPTCSIECRSKRRSVKKINLICENCGISFQRYPSHYRKERHQFCSMGCCHTWWTENASGWIHESQGCRYVCIGGKDILEHRYIMEQHLDRPLDINEIVHHINGDRLDNRLENLELMTKGEHSTLHNILRHSRNHATNS